MQPNSRKCLREELRENVLVKGVYEVTEVDNQQVDYVVSILNNHLGTFDSSRFTIYIIHNYTYTYIMY